MLNTIIFLPAPRLGTLNRYITGQMPNWLTIFQDCPDMWTDISGSTEHSTVAQHMDCNVTSPQQGTISVYTETCTVLEPIQNNFPYTWQCLPALLWQYHNCSRDLPTLHCPGPSVERRGEEAERELTMRSQLISEGPDHQETGLEIATPKYSPSRLGLRTYTKTLENTCIKPELYLQCY